MDRREFLTTSAVLGTVGLAGCSAPAVNVKTPREVLQSTYESVNWVVDVPNADKEWVEDGHVFVWMGDGFSEASVMECRDIASGGAVWSMKVNNYTISDGVFYGYIGDRGNRDSRGEMVARDIASGEVLWRSSAFRSGVVHTSDSLVVGEQVGVAVEKETGDVVFQEADEGEGRLSGRVEHWESERGVGIVNQGDVILGVDVESQTVLWEHENGQWGGDEFTWVDELPIQSEFGEEDPESAVPVAYHQANHNGQGESFVGVDLETGARVWTRRDQGPESVLARADGVPLAYSKLDDEEWLSVYSITDAGEVGRVSSPKKDWSYAVYDGENVVWDIGDKSWTGLASKLFAEEGVVSRAFVTPSYTVENRVWWHSMGVEGEFESVVLLVADRETGERVIASVPFVEPEPE